MKLHLHEYGLDGPTLIILHGLLGSGQNWSGFCRYFAPKLRLLALDMRNHGSSPHDADMSYAAMAADIYEVLLDYDLDQVHLLGHSMGGKAALAFATRWPERVQSLILGDVADREYPESGHRWIFDALESIQPETLDSLAQAAALLRDAIPENGLRQFLLKALERDPATNRLRWRINLKTLSSEYAQIRSRPELEGRFDRPSLVIRGGKSDYVLDSDLGIMRHNLPQLQCVTLKESGHWIHFDQPAAFRKIVQQFLGLKDLQQ